MWMVPKYGIPADMGDYYTQAQCEQARGMTIGTDKQMTGSMDIRDLPRRTDELGNVWVCVPDTAEFPEETTE